MTRERAIVEERLAMIAGLIILGACVLGALVVRVWWKLFNSADGERYLKMRVQGPFVPIETEDVEQLNK
ncbi:MAG: hypothetical protein H7228_01375 [Polaromonas sp.]|nr:hypothetical protein [Polaromonas sp.]